MYVVCAFSFALTVKYLAAEIKFFHEFHYVLELTT